MRTVWPFLLSRSVFAKSNKKLIFLVLKVRRFARYVPVEQKSHKTSRKLSFSPTDTVDKRKKENRIQMFNNRANRVFTTV